MDLVLANLLRILLSAFWNKSNVTFNTNHTLSSRSRRRAACAAHRPETDSGAVHRVAAQLRRGRAASRAAALFAPVVVCQVEHLCAGLLLARHLSAALDRREPPGLPARARGQDADGADQGQEPRRFREVAGSHQLDGAARHRKDVFSHAEFERRRYGTTDPNDARTKLTVMRQNNFCLTFLNTFAHHLFPAPPESARDSPMSDHSSHFDSVSGTAIHLGRNSRASSAERGGGGGHIQVVPLHQPVGKMSSLAKDAKECGPGLTKDSTLTRPAVPSSAASSSTARKKRYSGLGQRRY